MIDVREALKRIGDEVRPLDVEQVELGRAQGLVLAEDVVADRDSPPTDRSAMDGFAVRSTDLTEDGGVLELVGEIRAGVAPGGLNVGPGQAVRIMTGAVIPDGADAVVMVERTNEDREARRVRIHDLPVPGQHIRKRAESGKAGDSVLSRGRPIQAAEIAVLSSVGKILPRVHRRPVVRVLSTGDEIVDPGSTPLDHQLRNSNSASLLAQLRELGIEGHAMGIAADEADALGRTLAASLDADLLLVTGGVSVGDYDLVSSALDAHGMRLLFHGVAVKPGKPILVGRCGRCIVVGLPGNPVSAFAGFAVFVVPALRRMLGYREWRNSELAATLERPLRTDRKRQTYHLARVAPSPEGLTVRAVKARGSGDVLALGRANAFVVTTVSGRDLEAGTRVPVLLWRDLGLG